jgi:hypothetical protein
VPSEPVEKFRPTSGQVLGWIGIALVVTAVVFGAIESAWSVVTGALVVGVLDWAATLKPRVRVEGRWLVLRNMVETIRIPLAAVEEVAVRQVLAVRVGERRFVSPAVGKSLRQALKSAGSSPAASSATAEATAVTQAYPDFVEERIRHLATEARTREDVARYSAEQDALGAQVTRTPAWLEIGLLVVAVVAFVVTLVV